MRLPVIPLVVVVVLIGGAAFLVTRTSETSGLVLDVPDLAPLIDVEGIETEVAASPTGARYAVVASGNVWIAESTGEAIALPSTSEPASSPAWDGDDGLLLTRARSTVRFSIPTGEESVYRDDATHLTRAADGREAFVRDRGVWIATSADDPGRMVVPADGNADVSYRSLRFSPDGQRLAFIRVLEGFRGQLLRIDTAPEKVEPTTQPEVRPIVQPVVADRHAELATGVAWIDDERLAYVTDRGGGIAVWHIDLAENEMVPLTVPLMPRSLAPVGIDVSGQRILVPIHQFRRDIRTLEGRVLASGETDVGDPALSPGGSRMAYTVESNGVSEIWTATLEGTDARYLALGRHPRFAPNGIEVVFARTDLDGNSDIWKADVRTGLPTRLTDDPALDDTPDWSPDGRSILFFSDAEDRPGIWRIPPTGGQRVRWAPHGYWPRYSGDGTRVAFWNQGRFLIATPDGEVVSETAGPMTPAPPAWDDGNVVAVDRMRLPAELNGPTGLVVGPVMDREPAGSWVIETIDVGSTAIWRIDLRYVED